MNIKRTSLTLPSELHKAVKQESVNSERNFNDILVEQIAARYPHLVSLFFNPEKEEKLPFQENEQDQSDNQTHTT